MTVEGFTKISENIQRVEETACADVDLDKLLLNRETPEPHDLGSQTPPDDIPIIEKLP